jgi:hypothetical protein
VARTATAGRIPAEVYAYLRWLADLDTRRSAVAGEFYQAVRSRNQPSARRSQADAMRLAAEFSQLRGLDRFMTAEGASAGGQHVPPECEMLQRSYQEAMARQAAELEQVYGAASQGQADQPANAEMQTDQRVGELLRRADIEFQAICRSYGEPQFHRIRSLLGLPLTPGR